MTLTSSDTLTLEFLPFDRLPVAPGAKTIPPTGVVGPAALR